MVTVNLDLEHVKALADTCCEKSLVKILLKLGQVHIPDKRWQER